MSNRESGFFMHPKGWTPKGEETPAAMECHAAGLPCERSVKHNNHNNNNNDHNQSYPHGSVRIETETATAAAATATTATTTDHASTTTVTASATTTSPATIFPLHNHRVDVIPFLGTLRFLSHPALLNKGQRTLLLRGNDFHWIALPETDATATTNNNNNTATWFKQELPPIVAGAPRAGMPVPTNNHDQVMDKETTNPQTIQEPKQQPQQQRPSRKRSAPRRTCDSAAWITTTNHGGGNKNSMDRKRKCNHPRIGKDYQAVIRGTGIDIPTYYEPDQATSGHSRDCAEMGEILWQPSRLAEIINTQAEERNESDPYDFIKQGGELKLSMLRIEALHLSNYKVTEAKAKYRQLHDKLPHPTIELPEDVVTKLAQLFQEALIKKIAYSESLHRAAKLVNVPLETVLVHYYRWKASNYRLYSRLKRSRKSQSTICTICKRGGSLMLCDGCGKVYHRNCVSPLLDKVPDGEWMCPRCTAFISTERNNTVNEGSATTDYFTSPSSMFAPFIVNPKRKQQAPRPPQLQSPPPPSAVKMSTSAKIVDMIIPWQPKEPPPEYSACGLTWSTEEGCYLPNRSSSDVRTFDTKTSAPAPSAHQPQSSISNGARFSLVRSEISDGKINSIIDITLPIKPEGLLLSVVPCRVTSLSAIFRKYIRGPNKEIGEAEKKNVFRRGDRILAVDGVDCRSKTFEQVVSLLRSKSSSRTKSVRVERRRGIISRK